MQRRGGPSIHQSAYVNSSEATRLSRCLILGLNDCNNYHHRHFLPTFVHYQSWHDCFSISMALYLNSAKVLPVIQV